MVTTVERPSMTPKPSPFPTSTSSSTSSRKEASMEKSGSSGSEKPRRPGDLASRLNAIMQEKVGAGFADASEKNEENASGESSNANEESVDMPAESLVKDADKPVDTLVKDVESPPPTDAEKLSSRASISSGKADVDGEDSSGPIPAAKSPSLTPRTSLDTSDPSSLNLIIAQRERQLMNAMKETAHLNETSESLRMQLESRSTELSNSQKHARELEARIESLTAELEAAHQSHPRGNILSGSPQKTIEEQRAQLKAKDEQIAGLREEGEKLSKNELKHLTTIKKLRAEKTEKEKEVLDLQKKLDKAMADQVEKEGRASKASEAEKRANGRNFFFFSLSSMD